MSPLKEFQCSDCGHIQEELIRNKEDEPSNCPHCESTKLYLLPSAPGGYQIHGSNSASSRPRNAGSFKRGQK